MQNKCKRPEADTQLRLHIHNLPLRQRKVIVSASGLFVLNFDSIWWLKPPARVVPASGLDIRSLALRAGISSLQYPLPDSNERFRTESPTSWAARRRGRARDTKKSA